VATNLEPFRTAVDLIKSIPGFDDIGSHVVVSEIGIDMSRFLSAPHLVSWAGICPRNDESAGKRHPIACARALPGSRPRWCNAPGRQSKRKVATCRPCTTALKPAGVPRRPLSQSRRSILTAIYHMLKDGHDVSGISAPITSIVVPTDAAKKHAWSKRLAEPRIRRRTQAARRLSRRLWQPPARGGFVARSEQVSFLARESRTPIRPARIACFRSHVGETPRQGNRRMPARQRVSVVAPGITELCER